MLDTATIAGMQRAKGKVRAGFSGAGNRLRDLHQSGSLKALLPRNHAPVPDLVLVNTAGGLTGGDDYSVSIEALDSASVNVATQTAERVYKASAGVAQMNVSLTVKGGGTLCWMPQETILFDRSAIARKITAEMDEASRLLIVEPIVYGRRAMGETLETVNFADQWRIRQGGRLVHAEATRINGPFSAYQGIGALDNARASATFLYVASDAEDRLEEARSYGVNASAWGGRLVVRLLADDALKLRRQMTEFLTRFRGAPLPRVWTM